MSVKPELHPVRTVGFPIQSTSFIGRTQEIAEIGKQLVDPNRRLITLVGPGGIGKTRLASAVADRVKDAFPDGLFFVDLQPINTQEFLVTAIADIFDFSLKDQINPETQLIGFLRTRHILLVLDNFEHLIPDEGVSFLEQILRQTSGVTLLVTSREVLNLKEECLFPVQGLPVPENADENAESSAVELFTARASQVQPKFDLSEQRRDVVRICQIVEGIPLAIELAASWVNSLNCVEIVDEIERNLDFLTTHLRNVPQRHRSIQTVFEQTWERLSSEEKDVFQKMAVFRGGFRREAAVYVAGASLAILSGLVDKSLVQRKSGGLYSIHALLRHYGEVKLEGNPGEAERTRDLHCSYYAHFLHDRLVDLNGPNQSRATAEIAAEFENIRAAWSWAVYRSKTAEIQRAAGAFFFYCQLRSRFLEGVRALEAARDSLAELEAEPERDLTLAQILNHLGWLQIRVGDFEKAEIVLDESRNIYQDLAVSPPSVMGADSAIPLAMVWMIQGKHEPAMELAQAALQASQERSDYQNLSFAHYALTSIMLAKGDYESAYLHAQQACGLANRLGNRWFLAYPLNEWGNVARAQGNYLEAVKHYQASLVIMQDFNDPEGVAVALNHLGEVAILQRANQRARQLFMQSMEIYRQINDRGGYARVLMGLGQEACARQDYNTAKKWFRQALETADEIHYLPLIFSILLEVEKLLNHYEDPAYCVKLLVMIQMHPASQHSTKIQAEKRLKHLNSQLSEQEFARAFLQGREWELTSTVAEIMVELQPMPEPAAIAALSEPASIEPLTAREREVLRFIAEGDSNAEIANRLVISLGTVKWYASQIYGKLGVANRTEAAVSARKLGLV